MNAQPPDKTSPRVPRSGLAPYRTRATIDPWRYRTAQARHKPLSRVPKPNRGRAAGFFSFILSIQSQVLCKIIETIDVAGMHKQRLSRCALREDDVVPGQFYMQILDLGSLSG
jgi:hypothetical protein